MELNDFDIVSYDNLKKPEENENENENEQNDKSTQVEHSSIYLILHDKKCYGFADKREDALKIIKKIATNQLNFIKKHNPELEVYCEFDMLKNSYSIYTVNKMLLVSYDSLESIIKFIQVNRIK